ncbi:MAG: hypothetical protein KGJ09_10040, partial [Candidatus Omnitrophica bacterium]|nr:hypothetical protein [Candidatus Omnitrophota bacterium]
MAKQLALKFSWDFKARTSLAIPRPKASGFPRSLGMRQLKIEVSLEEQIYPLYAGYQDFLGLKMS